MAMGNNDRKEKSSTAGKYWGTAVKMSYSDHDMEKWINRKNK